MTQMGDVRAVQAHGCAAPTWAGRALLPRNAWRYPQAQAAADSEQVLHPSNCQRGLHSHLSLRLTASQERLGHDTKEEAATEAMMEKYLKAIGAWW